jgi:DNA-binding transcriptional ArsR family regulator
MSVAAAEMNRLERNAEYVAAVLKALSNPRRLLLLCKLAEHGTMNVGELAQAVGISQSALSQHLAVMREERLVTFERSAQTLHYRIADARLTELLGSLYRIYCND